MGPAQEAEAIALEAEKRALRRDLLARRSALPTDLARLVGDRIAAHVIESDTFDSAGHVALYAATGGEPRLDRLFEAGRAAGKVMTFPRCDVDGRLSFHVVGGLADLTRGRFGLLEPDLGHARVEPAALQIVLTPAVAVDDAGVRLGRGGGWYDRTFEHAERGAPQLIAAVHRFQCVDAVPRGPHDRVIDAVVSEVGLRWIEG